jgi:hypothetical protein
MPRWYAAQWRPRRAIDRCRQLRRFTARRYITVRRLQPGRINASAINGNHARKVRLLFNELYLGRIVPGAHRSKLAASPC